MVVGAVATAAVLVAALRPSTIAAEGVLQRWTLDGVARATGLAVHAHGALTVRWLPWPRVEVRALELRNAASEDAGEGAAIRGLAIDRIRMRLAPLRALFGNPGAIEAELSGVVLLGDPWPFMRRISHILALGDADGAPEASLGALRAITVRGLRLSDSETGSVAIPELRLRRSPDGAVRLHATLADGHGELALLAEATPLAPLPGDPMRRRLSVRAQGGGHEVTAIIRSWNVNTAHLDGEIDGTLDSRWLRRLSLPDVVLPRGPLTFSAVLALSPERLQLRGATFRAAGMEGSGGLAVQLDRAPQRLSGTLAFDTLELGRGRTPATLLMETSVGRPELQGRLETMEADLRFSARRLLIGGAMLQDAAGTFTVQADRWDAQLLRARLGEGTLRGRASIAEGHDGRQLRSVGSGENVPFTQLAALVGVSPRLSALGTVQWNVEGSGRSLGEVAATLSGRISATLGGGVLHGLALERMVASPIAFCSGRAVAAAAQTSFGSMRINGEIERGVLRFGEAELQSPRLLAVLRGEVDLGARTIEAELDTTDRTSATLTRRRFRLDGSWDAPVMLPRAQRMMERAAAP